MDNQTKMEIVDNVIKSSPPTTVATLTLFGIQINEWVLISTLVYTLLQCYFLIRNNLRRKEDERDRRDDEEASSETDREDD